MSAFAKLGIRDPGRLVGRTANELTAIVRELIEKQPSTDTGTVPYVRMLLPLALRAGYELDVIAVQSKGGTARRDARRRLLALARNEAVVCLRIPPLPRHAPDAPTVRRSEDKAGARGFD